MSSPKFILGCLALRKISKIGFLEEIRENPYIFESILILGNSFVKLLSFLKTSSDKRNSMSSNRIDRHSNIFVGLVDF